MQRASKTLAGIKTDWEIERKKERKIPRKKRRKEERKKEKEEERQAGSFYIMLGSKVFKQCYANTERKMF